MKQLFFLLVLLASLRGNAQNYEWANLIAGGDDVIPGAVVTDQAGNLYTIGYYWGTVDFDPSFNTFNLSSNGDSDIYLQKLDANGNFLWAKSIGGTRDDEGVDLALDNAGNIYLVGTFERTVDFDPNGGTFNLSAISFRQDGFLLKLDPNGNFVWAHGWGANTSFNMHGIAIDAAQNIDICGSFQGTTDFDPAATTFSQSSNGGTDAFLLRMNSAGAFQWVRTFGGSNDDLAISLDHDQVGNIYMCGSFAGTVDLDPSSNVASHTTMGFNDMYVQKYNPNGDFQWVRTMGAAVQYDFMRDIAIGPNGGVYTCGSYSGSGDFDPSATVEMLTSNGGYDIMVHKLDTSGNYAWVASLGAGQTDEALKLVLDPLGNVYVAGYFSGTVDFDGSAATYNLSTAGNFDPFLMKVTGAGGFVWARQLAGNLYGSARAIALDQGGAVYAAGMFEGTMDFDPGAATATLSTGSNPNTFQVKLSGSLLPVEYAFFEARPAGGAVHLNWETSTETNNSFFEVQRSGDGSHFEALGRVEGKGNSTVQTPYLFADEAPLNGVSWYRLRQVDSDGTAHLSEVVRITFAEEEGLIRQVYPSPLVGDVLKVDLATATAEGLQVKIYDASGRLMNLGEQDFVVSGTTIRLAVHKLPAGMYFLKMNQKERQGTYRFVVQ